MELLYRVSAPEPPQDVPFYFIESTAPDNVDEPSINGDEHCPDVDKLLADIRGQRVKLKQVPDKDKPDREKKEQLDRVIFEIAEHLLPDPDHDAAENANLVIMVHGFNNPRCSALKTFLVMAKAVREDPVLRNSKKLVCIGYRWPSEKMWGLPLPGSIRALPGLPFWLLLGSIIMILLHIFVFFVFSGNPWIAPFLHFLDTHKVWRWAEAIIVLLLPIALIVVTAVGILLRSVVYFRDIYRATNYGVPDLVDIVRDIDRVVWNRARCLNQHSKLSNPNRIAISFIGHSMGGLVVTNVIRILSDVFDPRSQTRSFGGKSLIQGGTNSLMEEQRGEGELPREEPISGDIGHVFSLMRLVLVSPDIPAEALIGNRANFLKSSLRRFKEAYLFSNEGDEVLRQISTMANYSSFPTKSSDYGYRLGNVEILSTEDGIIKSICSNQLLAQLRVGKKTIEELNNLWPAASHDTPADVFSYFDCTDCIDYIEDKTRRQPLLTFARRRKSRDEKGKIRPGEHLRLLGRYLVQWHWWHINVHGGYFEGATLRRLICRLACQGHQNALLAYGLDATAARLSISGEDELSKVCKDSQIKIRLSDPSKRIGPPPSPIVLQTVEELEEKTKKLENENLELNAKLLECQLELNKRGSPGVNVNEETGQVSIGTLKIPAAPGRDQT